MCHESGELSWVSAQEIHKAVIRMLAGMQSFLDMGMNPHLGSFGSQKDSVPYSCRTEVHISFLVDNQGLFSAFRGCPYSLACGPHPSSSKSAMAG